MGDVWGHRSGSNRPAYFEEYRAAFDRSGGHDIPPDVVDVLRAVQDVTLPGVPGRAESAAERNVGPATHDWRDGTDVGWGQ